MPDGFAVFALIVVVAFIVGIVGSMIDDVIARDQR